MKKSNGLFTKNFYKCSKVEQNQNLAGDVSISKKGGERKGHRRTHVKHNRQITAEYSLNVEGSIEMDQRGRHEPANKKIEERKAMLENIERCHKYESHYSRRDSQKKYLQSNLNIRMLHSEYKAEQNELILQHNEHKEMADLGYNLKAIDKTKANEDPTIRVLVFDLQQISDTPSLTANISFNKHIILTYNLTIRDCTTDGVTTHCYIGSEDIVSCVLKKLKSLPESVTRVITYSDPCRGQNRNINLACMFSLFVSKSNHVDCVNQKFLLLGHTHLEGDVDHARIERAKKNAQIPIMVP
ncbi:hypothetical protein PR048_011697 [Dryococelus australis]|uniref:Uncharacterized protein n=1 Tax=Dryococelus australis TaxID=614101 RepID=A0ABQ9HMB9_9NEOP|nr:hypothetical protein PR048_011697 [Dryococelus australis]